MVESPTAVHGRLKRTVLILLGAAVVALAIFLAGRALMSHDRPTPEVPEPPPPTFQNADPSVGYVGSEVCAECHEAEQAAYHATHHARSFGPLDPSSEQLPARFHHAASGLDYWIRAEDGALRVRESVTLSTGETEVLSDHALTHAIGSGRRARAFATQLDGFLVQAPVTWDASKATWALSEGYDLPVHAGFTLPLTDLCLTCHVGRFEIEGKSLNRVQVREAAIGCESCHGPGALHAELRRGPDAPPEGSKAPDDTIVSLGRMSRTQQTDVCARCHMDPYMTVVHAGKRRRDWRPGMPWEAVQTTYRPSKASVARHEFAGHVDQLRASRCFQQSATLTCITCHGGHRQQSARERQAAFNAQCVTCHDACARTPAEGEAAIPAPAADDCVACHMPRRETSELHLATTRHDIGVPAPGGSAPRPLPRAGPLTLHPLQEAEDLSPAERERNVGVAFLLASVRTSDEAIQLAYGGASRKALESARALGLEEAEQMAALGLFEFTQRIGPKGARKLERALALDAQVPSLEAVTRVRVLSVLVDYDLSLGGLEAARGYLEQLIRLRRDPEDWMRRANMEQVNATPDVAAAAAAARKALEILPNEPGVQFRAGDFLGALGFTDEKKRCDRIGQFLHIQGSKSPPK